MFVNTRERTERTHLDLTMSYMEMVHDPEALAHEADIWITQNDVDCDTLVGTGLSGALVLPTLARHLGKHFLVVRKPGDNSHSYLDVEGHLGKRWLFVDDFIDSGATFYRVFQTLRRTAWHRDFETELAGAFLYASGTPYRGPESMMQCHKEYKDWYNPEEES